MVNNLSSFTDDLIIKHDGCRKWELYTEFDYHVGDEKSDWSIHVPRGFQTDFASIPRIFWSILPPDGEYTGAAILHDYIYNQRGKALGPNGTDLNRAQADGIFLEAMTVLNVPWWKRTIMYHQVRLWGWKFWR